MEDGRPGHLTLPGPIELGTTSLLVTHGLGATKGPRLRPKVMASLLAVLPAVGPSLKTADMERRTATVVMAERTPLAWLPRPAMVTPTLRSPTVGRVMLTVPRHPSDVTSTATTP